MSSVSNADGMGNVLQTQITSDPDGTDYVDMQYNGLGLVSSQSNPHRSGPASTNGTTQYFYDAIGRKIEEKSPDGSVQQWCYDGKASISSLGIYCNSTNLSGSPNSWVDYTDANGNRWQRTSDALGRLVEVWEPGRNTVSETMPTIYTYDLLDNLLSVTQEGIRSSDTPRSRTFSYDSLSQLISSTNSETGKITYSYDQNGNVLSRTDARGITTLYTYDTLNRLTSKSYANDPSGTPTSCYQYGTSTAGNTAERLIATWTQSPSSGLCSSPTGNFWTKQLITSYDAMGRILKEEQFTPASSASGVSYSPSFTYDLAGDLISSTDGVTPSPTMSGSKLTFTYTYNGAGRLLTTTSNWYDSGAHPQTLFSVQTPQGTLPCTNSQSAAYAPFGGLWNGKYGNGFTISRAYDDRLRPECEVDTGDIVTTPTSGSGSAGITGTEQNQ
jgi:YD repeat-containing protein